MISSMTGFGRGIASNSDVRIQVEIKSVNSKQFDINMKLPAALKEMEVSLRNPLALKIGRGKVELWSSIEKLTDSTDLEFNTPVIEKYKLQLEELGRVLKIGEPSDWYTLLLRLPDTIKTEQPSSNEEEHKLFMQAVDEAVNMLIDFRHTEGEKLYEFFKDKIKNIRNLLKEVTPYEEERITRIKERLEENLERLASIEYDRGRLEQELIYYIEKLDVTEEKVRLESHLDYFLETLDTVPANPGDGQGKKLGFIAQEMGREINTLGSKSNQADMQKIVVKMKDELEQIKEQVLNVL